MQVKLIGKRMIYPILAAVATAWVEGHDLQGVIRALEALPPTRGRLQPIPLPNGSVVLRDDYKATVDTVHAALDVLEEVPARRRIMVLGDLDAPPAPERLHYRRVGERVEQIADVVMFMGTKFKAYRVGRSKGNTRPVQLLPVRSIQEGIETLQGLVQPGDVVLVKGRENQRLTRIVLGLLGSKVHCQRNPCSLHLMFCDHCPLLTRHQ
jgi:UDP-N-acetylmuramoyl-tripeptide--D-alanyl-D-alanine ligase